MRASARLCAAARSETHQAAARRPLAALAGGWHANGTRRKAADPAVSALSGWQATAWPSPSALAGAQPSKQQLHSSRLRARALTEDDIEADVGVMVEGEPAGVRYACRQKQRLAVAAKEGSFAGMLRPSHTLHASLLLCANRHHHQHHHHHHHGNVPLCELPHALVACPLPSLAATRSEPELEALCETLYNDSLALIKQAALYLLAEEEEERDEAPGARAVPLAPYTPAFAAHSPDCAVAAVAQLGPPLCLSIVIRVVTGCLTCTRSSLNVQLAKPCAGLASRLPDTR